MTQRGKLSLQRGRSELRIVCSHLTPSRGKEQVLQPCCRGNLGCCRKLRPHTDVVRLCAVCAIHAAAKAYEDGLELLRLWRA
jgi:hypothetical protein